MGFYILRYFNPSASIKPQSQELVKDINSGFVIL
jgi:hypothetical protein